MSITFSALLEMLLKAGAFLLVINEVRGAILAAPVFVAMYEAGGTWMALWLGFSALGGIAASVLIPAIAYRKLVANRV
jgi:hypothetical protein